MEICMRNGCGIPRCLILEGKNNIKEGLLKRGSSLIKKKGDINWLNTLNIQKNGY